MIEIADFIEARLVDDEATARGGWIEGAERGDEWIAVKIEDDELFGNGIHVFAASAPPHGDLTIVKEGPTDHISRHGPARVLRQVAAIRATLQHAVAAGEFDDGYHYEQGDGSTSEIRVDTLIHRALAGIWSDHPDYRPEWSVV